ncbi:MAG: NAD(+) synthase [Oscillospiraceae bacterium]
MKYGFVKASAPSISIRVADCMNNAERIISQIELAKVHHTEVFCTPELCVTGYTCGDLFLQQSLQTSALNALVKIIHATVGIDMLCFIGVPLMYCGKLYNCAAVISCGKLLGVVPKTNLPNYGEFNELRYFAAAPENNGQITIDNMSAPFGTKLLFACRNMPNLFVAAEICEDLWAVTPPSCGHALAGATMIVNLSAGDELIGKADKRMKLVASHSARLCAGYMYSNAGEGESSTDMVFSGHHIIAENGNIIAQTAPFTKAPACADIDVDKLAFDRMCKNVFCLNNTGYETIYFNLPVKQLILETPISPSPFYPIEPSACGKLCTEALAIQAHGLAKRMAHTNSQGVVIGISGGLDSCLALLAAVKAFSILHMPLDKIIAVSMPCFGTSERTHNNAALLCDALGVPLRVIPISATVTSHFNDIAHSPDNYNVTFENAQARVRTLTLMDIANENGSLVLGTGDMSELALGWATYGGDHLSMYGINAGVPKTMVRAMVINALNGCDEKLCAVLTDILNTPISPELLPTNGDSMQETEALVGPYALHDFYMYYLLRYGFTPAKIFVLAKSAFENVFNDEVILHWLEVFCRRFFAQQFKRSCMPDGPKVCEISLSPRGDLRMPSDAVADIWLDEIKKLKA